MTMMVGRHGCLTVNNKDMSQQIDKLYALRDVVAAQKGLTNDDIDTINSIISERISILNEERCMNQEETDLLDSERYYMTF